MPRKYYSKVSYGLLITVFLVFFSPLILNIIKNGLNQNIILTGLFLIILFGFISHMFFKTEYTIQDNKLKIRCGFFTYKPINIQEIKEITKTNNIISSPAASFDRIEIKYGKFHEIIISPKNKHDFAGYLTSINPEIKNNLITN
ncbi:MAG: PH domain-containing protein [Lacinutrix sp.]|uniref:PH domain-containing protein n=1 Tax=Lacinutrix sp. TaxID=1937692 RepID=UPI0030984E54